MKKLTWYTLIATWFGSGRSKFASGTVGSLATLPLAYVIHIYTGWLGLLIASIIAFIIGTVATHDYLKYEATTSDPKEVVVDEVAGQLLALALLAPTPLAYALGFLLFRAFDVVKPGPIGWADKHMKGALGVMVDDMLAGLTAALLPVATLYICSEYIDAPLLKNILNPLVLAYVP